MRSLRGVGFLRQEILKVLEGDSRLTPAQIAVMRGTTEEAVQKEIERLGK